MRAAIISSMLMMTSAAAQSLPVGNLGPVLGACSTSDGACQASVSDYIASLRGADLPTEVYSQAIADLVIALARLAREDGGCTGDHRRIAAAISYTGEFAQAAQVGQIRNISEAVAACSEFETAAITSEVAEPGSDN